MPDPSKHAESRGWIESVLRYIPGFRGYLEKGYRRESDELARKWLADQLFLAKRDIEQLVRNLTSQGRLADLNGPQQLLVKLDLVIGKLRSATAGYSGFFDFVQVDNGKLDEVYQIESGLMDRMKKLIPAFDSIVDQTENLNESLKNLEDSVEEFSREFAKRGQILAGLDG